MNRPLRRCPRPILAAAALVLAMLAACQIRPHPIEYDVYVPTPQRVVDEMLRLAEVGPGDHVIDLGSGDGRIVLTAVTRHGAQGFGVDIQEPLVARANESAARLGVADRANFRRQDLFDTDFSAASVLTLYLLPRTLDRLVGKLEAELRPGTRVVSHDYGIAGWRPDDIVTFEDTEKVALAGFPTVRLLLYRVPARVAGRWRLALPPELAPEPLALELRQQWQDLSARAYAGERRLRVEQVAVRGTELSFALRLPGGQRAEFRGQVDGDAAHGTVEAGGTTAAWHAARLRGS
ncbi:MAG TPA: methyltransferase domain-containing protein [Burkholderiaceae bacterium]|nr:methyltransferase domain-containing protein [Burkholderiaceae bacterium]